MCAIEQRIEIVLLDESSDLDRPGQLQRSNLAADLAAVGELAGDVQPDAIPIGKRGDRLENRPEPAVAAKVPEHDEPQRPLPLPADGSRWAGGERQVELQHRTEIQRADL